MVRPEDGLGSSPATVPPPQETFLSLGESPCCHENGFSKGPDPPPQGHRTGKTEMAREQRQKGAAKRGPGAREPRPVHPLSPHPHSPGTIACESLAGRRQREADCSNSHQPSPSLTASCALCCPEACLLRNSP